MATNWESSTAVQVFKSALICIFIVTAIIGNGCVIYAIKNYAKLQTIPNYFVLNLAIADFLFASTGMPMLLVTYIAKEWILRSFMCNVNGLCNTLFCAVSIWTLVMIGVNRYFAVAKATDIKRIYTKKRSFSIIGGVWGFSFLIAVPPLLGWSEFIPGTNFCTVNGKSDRSYSVFLAFFAYVLPIIALIGLYIKIFLLIQQHKRVMRHANIEFHKFDEMSEISDPNSVTCAKGDSIDAKISNGDKKVVGKYPSIENKEIKNNMLSAVSADFRSHRNSQTDASFDDNGNIPERKKTISFSSTSPVKDVSPTAKKPRKGSNATKKFFKETRVTKMLFVVVFCFFLCWTPFLISSTLYGLGVKPENFQLMTFGIIIACLNSVVNPIIYAAMNRNFRVVFQSMIEEISQCKLCCIKGHCSSYG